MTVLSLVLALILDLVTGGPPLSWRPRVLLRRLVTLLADHWPRRLVPARWQGIAFPVAVLLVTFILVSLATALGALLGVGWIVQGLLVYLAMYGAGAGRTVRQIAGRLQRSMHISARELLAEWIGNAFGNIGEKRLIGVSLERLASSLAMGYCAPLLYGLLGGAGLVWFYAAVRFLGSEAKANGRAPLWLLKLELVLEMLPSWCAAGLLALTAPLAGGGFGDSWRIARRDGMFASNPSRGIPVAAMAGALGVTLGGPVMTGQVLVRAPTFGNGPLPETEDLERGLTLFWVAYLGGALILAVPAALLLFRLL
ncbi:MAG: cobalamin biosynthesis protein [Synergistales bacterium]|nr:cobalamin biosynthesis protein [Synergistales bacterium]